MCGITAYLGAKQAAAILLSGLARLEYRGYDSAGLAQAPPDPGLARRLQDWDLEETFLALQVAPISHALFGTRPPIVCPACPAACHNFPSTTPAVSPGLARSPSVRGKNATAFPLSARSRNHHDAHPASFAATRPALLRIPTDLPSLPYQP